MTLRVGDSGVGVSKENNKTITGAGQAIKERLSRHLSIVLLFKMVAICIAWAVTQQLVFSGGKLWKGRLSG